MRLLQLTTSRGLLDLHPKVSIVQGMSAEDIEALGRAVIGLARHEAHGEGLLEAHGVMFPLDGELLRLLDPVEEGLEPVVRNGNLPGQVPGAAEREARTRTFEELLQRLAAAVEGQVEAAAAADAAGAAVTEAARRVDAVETSRVQAAAEAAARSSGAASARRAIAFELARLDELRAGLEDRLDPEAPAALAEASRRWWTVVSSPPAASVDDDEAEEGGDPVGLESGGDDAPADDGSLDAGATLDPVAGDAGATEPDETAPGPDPLEVEIERRIAVIGEVLAEMQSIDPEPLREALAMAAAPPVLVPVPEAGPLAEELAAAMAEVEADEAAGVPEISDDDRAASERLEAARRAVTEAEHAVRDLTISPEQAQELEAAHEALHNAIERADSPLAGPRARKRIEQLRSEEQTILDRLELRTYAEYLMGTASRHRSPVAEAALRAARLDLEAAEADWEAVAARQEAILVHAERRDRCRSLTEQARGLVGTAALDGDALLAALRDLRMAAPRTSAVTTALREALEAVGIDLGDEPVDDEDLLLIAETWLDEAEQVATRREALLAERAELEKRAARSHAPDGDPALEEGGPTDAEVPAPEAPVVDGAEVVEPVEAEPDPAVEAERAAALAELEVAERRHQAHRDALDAIEALAMDAGRLRAELEQADEPPGEDGAEQVGAELDDLRRSLTAAEEAHALALEQARALGEQVEALEAEGAAAAAALEQLRADLEVVASEPLDRSEIEWFLMAKVAAQRATSVAGSTPLLIDDALPDLSQHDVHHLLDQLERMADTVQVIVVSDAPHLAAWVDVVGEARAAVVQPVAP